MKNERRVLPLEPMFKSDVDWQCNACLNYSHDTMELYVCGYKDAADCLVAEVIEKGHHQDFLVFPICFLYRHYIELRLKEIIVSGRCLLEEKADFHQDHDIMNLWVSALAILKEVFAENVDSAELKLAAHVVKEFSKLDPSSFAFRYPSNKKGKKNLKGIKHINLRRVAEYVDAFAELMDGVSLGISTYLDNKAEMMSTCTDF